MFHASRAKQTPPGGHRRRTMSLKLGTHDRGWYGTRVEAERTSGSKAHRSRLVPPHPTYILIMLHKEIFDSLDKYYAYVRALFAYVDYISPDPGTLRVIVSIIILQLLVTSFQLCKRIGRERKAEHKATGRRN